MIYFLRDGRVFFDESLLSEEQKREGWAIPESEMPQDTSKEGHYSDLKFDFDTKRIWYEHTPIPVPFETEVGLALAELAEAQEQGRLSTQLALAELAESMMGGNA